MSDGPELPPEHGIVSARISGALSIDASFERLYRIYASVVSGWLVVRVESASVEDLVQDVWTVFYRRWQTWQQPPEMDTPAARPVLSFLFRTVHLATMAHLRGKQAHDSMDGIDPPDKRAAPQRLFQQLTLGRCLDLARTHCSAGDVEILVGKLAGVSAKEIARTLRITESAVEHRYRNVVEFLRQQLHSGRAESKGLGRIN